MGQPAGSSLVSVQTGLFTGCVSPATCPMMLRGYSLLVLT